MRTRRLTLVKAIGVRLLFLLHCLLAISRVSAILSESKFWIHSVGFVLVFLEGFHAVYCRQGMEHKWVSLGTFLFICLDIVPIWIMELDHANRATGTSGAGTLATPILTNITTSTNDTSEEYLLSFFNLLVSRGVLIALHDGERMRPNHY
ncbi:transmembrane protein 26-like [Ostrea edulis]|uniref:transmembrane protein 26-like n=1 Tax=Ostrea edulis TaxID=37623 RepID=UPI0024AFEC4D|nr:transmembrane protein 26-like [Ostrea edulis]